MSDLNQLTPDQLQRLSQINDIDLPTVISWWPLAWGWWILIITTLVLMIGGLLGFYLRKSYLRSAKKQALTELALIEQSSNTDKELAYQLSVLLKRVVLTELNKKQITNSKKEVTLSGNEWADFLVKKTCISQQTAAFIAHAPYSLNYVDLPKKQQVITEVRQWINRVAK